MGYTIHFNCDHGMHHSRQLWPWDTPFTATVTKGYTTPFYAMLVVVINWSRDVGLSQIDVRCLRLQIWQPERHLHSAARCRLPVQLKLSDCHKLVTIHSSGVSCVTVDTPSLWWRCFVWTKCFFLSFIYSSLSCIQPITSGLAQIIRGKCGSPLPKVTLTELSISNLRHAFTLN